MNVVSGNALIRILFQTCISAVFPQTSGYFDKKPFDACMVCERFKSFVHQLMYSLLVSVQKAPPKLMLNIFGGSTLDLTQMHRF